MTSPAASGWLAPLLAGLLDDAAVFPPGSAVLPAAVTAHRAYRAAWYRDLVGPLVLPASALVELSPLLSPGESLALAVTLPGGPGGIASVLDLVTELPIELAALEVAVPADITVPELIATLTRLSPARRWRCTSRFREMTGAKRWSPLWPGATGQSPHRRRARRALPG
jgi:hypothetical protein